MFLFRMRRGMQDRFHIPLISFLMPFFYSILRKFFSCFNFFSFCPSPAFENGSWLTLSSLLVSFSPPVVPLSSRPSFIYAFYALLIPLFSASSFFSIFPLHLHSYLVSPFYYFSFPCIFFCFNYLSALLSSFLPSFFHF